MHKWYDKIFHAGQQHFDELALEIFQYQYQNNPVYRNYADALRTDLRLVERIEQVPFLPISFFKSSRVITGGHEAPIFFESSGTTATVNSRHYVMDVDLYRESFRRGFELFYGDIRQYCLLALLPSYLERKTSSLVMMADELIRKSGHEKSGFYLYDHAGLHQTLLELESAGTKTILLGVSFALLDFSEQYHMQLKHTIVMETGGMKGRREELTRSELHDLLCQRLGIEQIHSEYGMTELLSQAYAKKNGLFNAPPWMKVLLREEDDPFAVSASGRGVINIIDLANVHSCSFIATDDIGRLYDDGSFEMLGRMDNADIRGCSLMVI